MKIIVLVDNWLPQIGPRDPSRIDHFFNWDNSVSLYSLMNKILNLSLSLSLSFSLAWTWGWFE